jgi:hypothetical protein
MSIYIVGIGGTGAKCIESIIQLAAIGAFANEEINLLFVDADETNGNLDRAKRSLEIYRKCYELGINLDNSPWLKTKITSYGLWSPFAKISINKNLGALFEYNNLKYDDPPLGKLFDVLYTEDERELTLDEGFRGRPAIGAAVMSRVNLEGEDPWGAMISKMKTEPGTGTKIFLCGSIFGGTGASGLPTIGRLIGNKLEKENIRHQVQIGCLFVLPYFGFIPTLAEEQSHKVYARSDEFLLNTEAALRYYANQAKEIFDNIYLLGNEALSNVKFSIGRNSQRNEPHFIELYAALATRHFLYSPKSPEKGEVVLISRQMSGALHWGDLPDIDDVKPLLINTTRFAFVWLGEIVSQLNTVRTMGVKNAKRALSWFSTFYPSQGFFGGETVDFDSKDQQEGMTIITQWCQDYLRWLYDIHQSKPENIQLFNANYFSNPEGGVNSANFPDLVLGETREETKKKNDTVQNLLNNSSIFNNDNLSAPSNGTIGLAKAVYRACEKQY